MKKFISNYSESIKIAKWWQIPILFLLSLSLIIPIRGGIQTIPINISDAFFSNQRFSNHSAINFAWHFLHDLSNRENDSNPFKRLSDKQANSIIQKKKVNLKKNEQKLLDTKNPNVILIIWESLTSKIVGIKKEGKEITPRFNRLIKEGIFFDNFYANGTRSDKGLISILSGYYPQPNKSIMKLPNKSKKLPTIFKEFSSNGYSTSFYYGGDMNFANLKSYIMEGGVKETIDDSNFKKSDGNSKWGTFDHIVLDKILKDIRVSNFPFFKTIFTITSHEPFELPSLFEYEFGLNTEEDRFLSSHYYTDQSIGNFVDEIKKEGYWKNSIIIIVADHGHPLPKTNQIDVGSDRFHIPLLITGGALSLKDTIISKFCSQVDLSYSLLSLLDFDNTKFTFSNNIFDENSDDYANYIFTKGFGILNNEGSLIYDYDVDRVIYSSGKQETIKDLELKGKAITQIAFQDYLDK